MRPVKAVRTRAASIAVSSALALAIMGLNACAGSRAGRDGRPPESIFELFAPPTPAEAAAWASDQYDPDKRYRGTLLLANAPFGGESVYVELYTKAAADEDPSVRSAAIRGLALHGSVEHVPLILDQIGDEDRLLRWECCRALQRLHDRAAVPALLQRLDPAVESEPIVRQAAAEALGQYPESRVLDGLIAALRDRDLAVNHTALNSLRTLTGQDMGHNFRQWIAWQKQTETPFAGRQPYVYPVFYRDRKLVEVILPIFSPPNEIAATPVGMDPNVGFAPQASNDSSQQPPPAGRNN